METRQSNIELLRIIATFFIVIVHCNGWFLKDWGGVSNWTYGGLVSGIWRVGVQSVTCIGVNLFVLISGYFSIKPKLSSIANLFSILFFFYVGGYLSGVIMDFYPLSFQALVKEMMCFSRENWFIQCYLFLMLLSPLLNRYAESSNRKHFSHLLVVFITAAFYFGCIHDSTYFYFNQGYSVTTFILIYLIGRYLKMYGVVSTHNIKTRYLVLIYILSVGVMSVMRVLPISEDRYLSYCSPMVIFSSVVLFLCFTRMSFFSKFVNWVGVSCLSVYVMHTCTPLCSYLANEDVFLFKNESLFMWILSMAGMILAIFVVSIALDKVRVCIFKPLLFFSMSIVNNIHKQ